MVPCKLYCNHTTYNLLFYQHDQCWFTLQTLYFQYGIEGTDMQDWCLSCCCGACSEFQVKTHSSSSKCAEVFEEIF